MESNPLKDCTSSERHAHKCSSCGHVWAHDYSDPLEFLDNMPLMRAEEDRYADAHSCPNCGNSEFHVYDGDDPIKEVYDGIMSYPPTPDRISPENPSKSILHQRMKLRFFGEMLHTALKEL